MSYNFELGLETVRWRFFTGIVQFSRQILARTVNFPGLRCDLSPPIRRELSYQKLLLMIFHQQNFTAL